MKTLLFIMDPLNTLHTEKDSSLAMIIEAQRRNYTIYYAHHTDLFLQNGIPHGFLQKLYYNDQSNFQVSQEKTSLALANLNLIFIRKDPPFDLNYLYTTQLLELAEKAGVRILNKPRALRDFNEKLFISYFPQCCVPTLVSAEKKQITDFLLKENDIICKPLHGMGGAGIFRMQLGDSNINVIIETLTQQGQVLCISQRYIPEIKEGDKRIILIDGEPVPFALARIPKAGETRANLAQGGKGIIKTLTERDYWICAQLKPMLQSNGLFFVGIDVIGDYLTEINITSPTGIREIDAQSGLNIAEKLFDKIERGIN